MWHAIQGFLAAQLKVGGIAFKVWQLVWVGTVLAAGTAGGTAIYVAVKNAPVPQHVVVFISGMNTSMTACYQDAFYDDTNNQVIRPLLSQAGVDDPYTRECNGFTRNYLHSSSSMLLYSYTGGVMDHQHGVWVPNDFGACDVDNQSLQIDIQHFDDMLTAYHKDFPLATFTIVGHSLGGLLALQGAYDYAIAQHQAGHIDKVITLDAPLNGVVPDALGAFGATVATLVGSCHLSLSGAVVQQAIGPLGQAAAILSPVPLATRCVTPSISPSVVLSGCAALALAQQAHTAVITLGNQLDSLYCGTGFANMLAALRSIQCETQELPPESGVVEHLYTLEPTTDDSGFAAGHGTILQTLSTEEDIVHYILGPVTVPPSPTAAPRLTPTPTPVTIRGAITEFAIPTDHSTPDTIIKGSDGNLWFTEYSGNKIGRINTAGNITEFAAPSTPTDITPGPDGAFWFTEQSDKIGRITTNGRITEFSIPTMGGNPFRIVAGPDGALWFTWFDYQDTGKIERMTTGGSVVAFPLPTAHSGALGITVGPDGALWFTEDSTIGRITTGGTITEFPLPPGGRPESITAGPDGALWFTEDSGDKIGRISTDGQITEYTIPFNRIPKSITAGPDGALWFVEAGGDVINRITTSGSITEFAVPTANSTPTSIAAGPDSALWFTEDSGNKIGRLS